MRNWLYEVARDLHRSTAQLYRLLTSRFHAYSRIDRLILALGLLFAGACLSVGLVLNPRTPRFHMLSYPTEKTKTAKGIDLKTPVRKEPARFPPNTYLPNEKEFYASGPIRLLIFFPKYDLVHVDDPSVWWESDHDTDDVENDHLIHYRMEEPLRRLIELVNREGGTLKVQDAYREEGVHRDHSLHKEGRAIDLTCDKLGLEKLARLCWASGFDWVYHEAPKRGGAHVHCSVKAQP